MKLGTPKVAEAAPTPAATEKEGQPSADGTKPKCKTCRENPGMVRKAPSELRSTTDYAWKPCPDCTPDGTKETPNGE